MSTTAHKKRMSGPSYILKDYNRPAETALFYGFRPIKTPRIEKKDYATALTLLEQKKDVKYPHGLYPRPEERAAILRTYTEWNLVHEPHPLMLFYERPFAGSAERRNPHEVRVGLEIIGAASGMADAIALKTTHAILSDYGLTNLNVEMNSVGDKESMVRFERELGAFVRKQSGNLPPELRNELRRDPFEVLFSPEAKEEYKDIRNRAPQSLGCLSETSSSHFKEVLEHIEALDMPYRINHHLIPERSFCSHTIFEIQHTEENTSTVVACGSRHNHISKKIGLKKDVPIVSVHIAFKKRVTDPKPTLRSQFRPKFYFIQFGGMAKLKSLRLIEALRCAKIPVHHSLTRDKFVGQLSVAETIESPFVIIMGQKEALDNTVVVRHMSTRAQEIVPMERLVEYLSKLR